MTPRSLHTVSHNYSNYFNADDGCVLKGLDRFEQRVVHQVFIRLELREYKAKFPMRLKELERIS